MCLAEFASMYKSSSSKKSYGTVDTVEDNCSQESEQSGIDEPLV